MTKLVNDWLNEHDDYNEGDGHESLMIMVLGNLLHMSWKEKYMLS